MTKRKTPESPTVHGGNTTAGTKLNHGTSGGSQCKTPTHAKLRSPSKSTHNGRANSSSSSHSEDEPMSDVTPDADQDTNPNADALSATSSSEQESRCPRCPSESSTASTDPIAAKSASKAAESDDTAVAWLGCDRCKTWFHAGCVDLRPQSVVRYICKTCEVANPHDRTVTREERPKRAKLGGIDYNALNGGEHVNNLRHLYTTAIETRPFAARQVVEFDDGTPLTKAYIDQNGFDKPIVIHNQDGLDMVIPSDLTVDQVADSVGREEPIEVLDVPTQEGCKGWTLGKWADFYNESTPTRVRNVISLEISHSDIGKQMSRPKLVHQLDIVDSFWPKKRFAIRDYPKVQLYCLMSLTNSYTDFHVDFAGTSVFYHIVRGRKTFLFIPPTPANLNKYREWCSSSNQSTTFLADACKETFKIDLGPGDTMMIPSGWIHAVHTPEKSLVIGGNFLSLVGMTKHLGVVEIEDRTKVPTKFRFPSFGKLMWYVAVGSLTRRPSLSTEERRGLFALCRYVLRLALFAENKEDLLGDRTPTKAEVEDAKESIPRDIIRGSPILLAKMAVAYAYTQLADDSDRQAVGDLDDLAIDASDRKAEVLVHYDIEESKWEALDQADRSDSSSSDGPVELDGVAWHEQWHRLRLSPKSGSHDILRSFLRIPIEDQRRLERKRAQAAVKDRTEQKMITTPPVSQAQLPPPQSPSEQPSQQQPQSQPQQLKQEQKEEQHQEAVNHQLPVSSPTSVETGSNDQDNSDDSTVTSGSDSNTPDDEDMDMMEDPLPPPTVIKTDPNAPSRALDDIYAHNTYLPPLDLAVAYSDPFSMFPPAPASQASHAPAVWESQMGCMRCKAMRKKCDKAQPCSSCIEDGCTSECQSFMPAAGAKQQAEALWAAQAAAQHVAARAIATATAGAAGAMTTSTLTFDPTAQLGHPLQAAVGAGIPGLPLPVTSAAVAAAAALNGTINGTINPAAPAQAGNLASAQGKPRKQKQYGRRCLRCTKDKKPCNLEKPCDRCTKKGLKADECIYQWELDGTAPPPPLTKEEKERKLQQDRDREREKDGKKEAARLAAAAAAAAAKNGGTPASAPASAPAAATAAANGIAVPSGPVTPGVPSAVPSLVPSTSGASTGTPSPAPSGAVTPTTTTTTTAATTTTLPQQTAGKPVLVKSESSLSSVSSIPIDSLSTSDPSDGAKLLPPLPPPSQSATNSSEKSSNPKAKTSTTTTTTATTAATLRSSPQKASASTSAVSVFSPTSASNKTNSASSTERSATATPKLVSLK
ncbi:JmjC domain-containing histone demethylation protein 1 [Savitreella phatthalungensis]